VNLINSEYRYFVELEKNKIQISIKVKFFSVEEIIEESKEVNCD
jgi:hypothetical protein